MYYEINVSSLGRHFFATAERSIITLSQLKSTVKLFREKFPESEGYSIEATYHPNESRSVNLNGM